MERKLEFLTSSAAGSFLDSTAYFAGQIGLPSDALLKSKRSFSFHFRLVLVKEIDERNDDVLRFDDDDEEEEEEMILTVCEEEELVTS